MYPHPSRKEENFFVALPPLQKKIIYLDQMVISNMMKSIQPQNEGKPEFKMWKDLFDILSKLSQLQLICCPRSELHTQESVVSPFFEALKEMYYRLGSGISFSDFQTIKRRQFWKSYEVEVGAAGVCEIAIKVLEKDPNIWNDRIMIMSTGKWADEWIESQRKEREAIHLGMKNLFDKRKQESSRTFQDWYQIEIQEHGRLIVNEFVSFGMRQQELYDGIRLPSANDMWGPPNLAQIFIDLVDIGKNHGLEPDEQTAAPVRFLNSKAIEDIPHVKLAALLHAAIAREGASGRTKPPNQGMYNDIELVSVLLPYCDAMFLDNGCAEYLAQNPLNQNLYRSSIYCQNSMTGFFEYLHKLESNCAPNHLQAVKEVYGINPVCSSPCIER